MRQNKETYFIAMANMVSTRSTCLRHQHGAVLVRDGNVIGTGYNGAPCKTDSCDELGQCERERMGIEPGTHYELCAGLHAEQNAIIQAAKHGHAVSGSTIYVTGPPCLLCTRMIINAGIVDVIYQESDRYAETQSLKLLDEAGVAWKEV